MSDVMTIDLSNYKDRIGARVKPDRYRVVVEDVEPDKSNAGNPMINVWFRIIGGEFDGQTIVDRLTITEKALFRVVNFLSAIGMPTPKKELKIQPRTFIGKRLDIDVEDGEPYNGRVKSEVRGYLRIPKSEAQESAGAGDLDEFASEPASKPADTAAPAAEAAPAADAAPEVTGVDSDGEVDLDKIDL